MPLGYKIVNGKVIFDKEKVAVIIKIFEDYQPKISLQNMTNRLNPCKRRC